MLKPKTNIDTISILSPQEALMQKQWVVAAPQSRLIIAYDLDINQIYKSFALRKLCNGPAEA